MLPFVERNKIENKENTSKYCTKGAAKTTESDWFYIFMTAKHVRIYNPKLNMNRLNDCANIKKIHSFAISENKQSCNIVYPINYLFPSALSNKRCGILRVDFI